MENKKRNYTVTDVNHKDGAEFIHNGRLYRRSHIAGAIFDQRVADDTHVAEFIADEHDYSV